MFVGLAGTVARQSVVTLVEVEAAGGGEVVSELGVIEHAEDEGAEGGGEKGLPKDSVAREARDGANVFGVIRNKTRNKSFDIDGQRK